MPTKLPLSANYNSLMNSDVFISDTIYSVTLTASTDTTLTVPTGSDLGGTNTSSNKNYMVARIRHTPGNDVYFAIGATAAAPAGNTFAATTSDLLDNNVCEYLVKSGDVMHFYTAASSVHVYVSFYWQT